ncbi:MAG: hypothetical protein SOR61_02045 [Evtepia sp.]|uniref:hypothetical protein n=1 Tax=Evtepia sp. TaxID=2773933 RepID=UPI002A764DA3|nr:hypothetical protein [Evtepia sp.]MDY3013979.1 hypothetical protein [Evtepia sp.]
MKKRLCSLLIAIIMVLSLMPANAIAVEGKGTNDVPSSTVETRENSKEYQGPVISCTEGNVADKVKLEASYGSDGKRQSIVIKESGDYTISGTWNTSIWDEYAQMGAVLIIDTNVEANITLHKVNIRSDQAAASNSGSSGICCKDGSKVTLTLDGENTIYGQYKPAIELQGAADVTITGDGSLTAVCGKKGSEDGRGPGIGVFNDGGGTLKIYGGTIKATGDLQATGSPGGAGIGDNGISNSAVLEKIIIEERDNHTINLTAIGGRGAPGIGSNTSGSTSDTQIIIRSGRIIAKGGEVNNYYGGPGIGGGDNWISSSISPGAPEAQIDISGGNITAEGTDGGAGIGGGYRSAPSIHITGGDIRATGGPWGAGIGAGVSAQGGNIDITGGKITAVGKSGSAGVGGGYYGTGMKIAIGGNTDIIAIGSDSGEGIGAGSDGSIEELVFSGTPNIIAGAQNGLAVSEKAAVSGFSILNGQFKDVLPDSIFIQDKDGKIIKEHKNLGTLKLKSIAYSLQNKEQTLLVGQTNGTFACVSENEQDVFEWNAADSPPGGPGDPGEPADHPPGGHASGGSGFQPYGLLLRQPAGGDLCPRGAGGPAAAGPGDLYPHVPQEPEPGGPGRGDRGEPVRQRRDAPANFYQSGGKRQPAHPERDHYHPGLGGGGPSLCGLPGGGHR